MEIWCEAKKQDSINKIEAEIVAKVNIYLFGTLSVFPFYSFEFYEVLSFYILN